MKKSFVILALIVFFNNNFVFSQSEVPLKNKITFTQLTGNFWQIWIMDLDGLNPKLLTNSPIDKVHLCFSYDGKKIAYTTNKGELWIMDSEGSNNSRTDLPISCFEPRFSPDNEKIVFTSYQDIYHGNTELWEYNFKTKKLIKLTNRAWLQYNPDYSPKGDAVIFTDGPELYGQEIRKLNLETKDITQLTDNGPFDYDMQANFFPDGERIVYSSNQSGNYDIWLMDKFGRKKTNLSKSADSFDVLPAPTKDGKNVFFISDKNDGIFRIWKIDLKTKKLKQISKNNSHILYFSIYEN